MAACKGLFWMAGGTFALLGCAVAPGFDHDSLRINGLTDM
jgi:predicted cupin superfamily sugar epimerase